jgi:hypothetical protein
MISLSKGITLSFSLPSPLRGGRTHLVATAAVLLVAAGALADAPTSRAATGVYGHLSCAPESLAAVDAAGGWVTRSSVNIPGVETTNDCAAGRGLNAQMNPGSSGLLAPLGATVGWQYKAPTGTQITSLSMTMYGWARAFQTPSAANRDRGLLRVWAENKVLSTFDSSENDATTAGRSYSTAVDDTSSLDVAILCDGPTGDDGCYYQTGTLSLHRMLVQLSDGYAPKVESVSGEAKTDQKLKGAATLAYSATDGGGGIARFRLYVDGVLTVDREADASSTRCQKLSATGGAWVYATSRPCPSSVDTVEKIDTTAIADGVHSIRAAVVDAAQREATIMTRSDVLIANHPPANTALPAFADNNKASVPHVGDTLAFLSHGSWTGPNLTMAYAWEQCDVAGAHCAPITGSNTLSYKTVADDAGHRLRLSVTATNVAGSATVSSAPTGIVTDPSSATGTIPKPVPGADGAGGSGGAGGAAGAPGASAVVIAQIPTPLLPTFSVGSVTPHRLLGRVAGEAEGVACPHDRATLKFEHVKGGRIALRFGRKTTALVELTCTETGRAITGAKLELATQVARQPAVAADVTTDGAGHATLRIAKGASRGITVGYRMYADDPIARAKTTLKVLVDGRILIKATKKRVRNGEAVHLRGSLAGGQIPSRGVDLAVQWKDGKRWRPFAQIRTDRKGRFTYAYKFTRTSHEITYALRVQVTKGQVDYPFVAAASKAVRVTVAP